MMRAVGPYRSLVEASLDLGIPVATIRSRLRRGATDEEALMPAPPRRAGKRQGQRASVRVDGDVLVVRSRVIAIDRVIAALRAAGKLEEHGGDPWAEHSDVPVSDWQAEVANGDTRLGYLDFVRARLATAADDSD